jgi:hypothetical protein
MTMSDEFQETVDHRQGPFRLYEKLHIDLAIAEKERNVASFTLAERH